MSNVHRWRTEGTTRRDDDGHWVLYSDHQAEVERLKDEIERLTDERDDAAKAERARCIRAIQCMPVPINQANGAMRAIAVIKALATQDTP